MPSNTMLQQKLGYPHLSIKDEIIFSKLHQCGGLDRQQRYGTEVWKVKT